MKNGAASRPLNVVLKSRHFRISVRIPPKHRPPLAHGLAQAPIILARIFSDHWFSFVWSMRLDRLPQKCQVLVADDFTAILHFNIDYLLEFQASATPKVRTMLQLPQILFSLPRLFNHRHGTPAVVLGHIATVLAKWTAKWICLPSSSSLVLDSTPSGTPTSPLIPTPTVSSQVDSKVPIAYTLAASSVCVILILGTFCASVYKSLRPSGSSSETSPPLFEIPVAAPPPMPTPKISWVTQVTSFLGGRAYSFNGNYLVLNSALGRFQMPSVFSRPVPHIFSLAWTQLCANDAIVMNSTLGRILRFLDPRQWGPSTPPLLICGLWSRLMIRTFSDLSDGMIRFAKSTLGRFLKLVFFGVVQQAWVAICSSTTRLIRKVYGTYAATLVCILSPSVVCLIAASTLYEFSPSTSAQIWMPLDKVHPRLLLLAALMLVVKLGFDLTDRLVVYPVQGIITLNRLRVLANGQLHDEFDYRLVGIKDAKTASCMVVLLCFDAMILSNAVNCLFPNFGCFTASFAIHMTIVTRCMCWVSLSTFTLSEIHFSNLQWLLPPEVLQSSQKPHAAHRAPPRNCDRSHSFHHWRRRRRRRDRSS
ncbi:hypothetical protein FPV67DRAFT_631879 [Lyophyllum atratum]|nr:hypothetical protein FPV67DRAFT_631879 [Lyophyllum atratum]